MHRLFELITLKQEEEAQKSGQIRMRLHHLHAKRERWLKENLNDIEVLI